MEYRKDLDIIKGISILAVIFYHIGMLPYGFLGVDAFLVISGYLLIPQIFEKICKGDFSYTEFIKRRIIRLWPIVVSASVLCLGIGYFVMMPDSYENLGENVVASNFFAGNILSALTIRNYWNTANEFNPLMQMWYLGVLVQFYLFFPLILMGVKKMLAKHHTITRALYVTVIAIIGLSLSLYIFYPAPFGVKFYYTHFRVWELCIGGIIGLFVSTTSYRLPEEVGKALCLILVVIFLYGLKSLSEIDTITIIGMPVSMASRTIKVIFTIATVIVTSLILCSTINTGSIFGWLGKMSLSLFIWHQVLLAFMRYSIVEHVTPIVLFIYLIITLLVSILSYKWIEPVRLSQNSSVIIFAVILLSSTAIGYLVYLRAGVVRDVPELGISYDYPTQIRNTEYIDQVKDWHPPFITDKKHIMIVGNSFARDFGCILKEYDTEDRFEKIYYDEICDINADDAKKADYIFVFGDKHQLRGTTLDSLPVETKIYGIGTKSFGKNFGLIYAKRNEPDYFQSSIYGNAICDSINAEWKSQWGENNFFDLMQAARNPDGRVRLFTPNRRIISFDCNHLTRDACIYYAHTIDFDSIFTSK